MGATLHRQATRTTTWVDAARTVACDIAAGLLDDPFRHVCSFALAAGDADLVTVLAAGPDDDNLLAVATAGTGAGADTAGWDGCLLDGRTTPAAQVLRSGTPVVTGGDGVGLPGDPTLDSWLLVPVAGTVEVRAVLALGRAADRPAFTGDDLTSATLYAGQVALALELADGPARRDRLVRLDERDRLARDLTVQVVGRLFRLGMALQGAAADAPPAIRRQLQHGTDELDDTVTQLRAVIHRLATTPD